MKIALTNVNGQHPTVEGLNRIKSGRMNLFSLSEPWCDIYVLLSLYIDTHGFWAFGLRKEFIPSVPLIFRPLYSD